MNDQEAILTSYQKQLLLGTLMGTSSLIKRGRSAFLKMRQSLSADLRWFQCKAAELQELGRQHSFLKDKDSWHWTSQANPVWLKYLELCYKEGVKTVSKEWLYPMTDVSWAAWFLDSGTHKDGQVSLKTVRFGKEGNEIIAAYLTESGYECRVEKKPNSPKIVLTKESTEKYLKLILPRFPKYLLDHLSQTNPSCTHTSEF